MARNYPDGMRESDIPGYWDTECTNCEEYWLTHGRDEAHEIDPDCPYCDGTGMVDSRAPLGDPYADYCP